MFCALFALALAANKHGVTDYDRAALRCLSSYKACALGHGSCCTCAKLCGKVGVPTTQKNDEICSTLQNYCLYYVDKHPPPDCIEPNCIAEFELCVDKTKCKGCPGICRECPEQFKVCAPGQPIPTKPPVPSCPQFCTYYKRLCYYDPSSGSTNINCNKCYTACGGIHGCEQEAAYCKPGVIPDPFIENKGNEDL